jgi:hypothetical protein
VVAAQTWYKTLFGTGNSNKAKMYRKQYMIESLSRDNTESLQTGIPFYTELIPCNPQIELPHQPMQSQMQDL